ncbi:MAG: YbjQ family protein [Candidatus Krumholzibacteriota bacterium]|nr:YbjQ family protein [Candidatus Krumholzibacteriota bacterium]
MKVLRQIGSLIFVVGLFVVIFVGVPWYVLIAEDPAVPLWLQIAIFGLLGGILVVLVTLAFEKRTRRAFAEEPVSPEPDREVLLINTDTPPGREITEVLGIVQGHTVFAIWLGRDLSALVRLILGGELTEYTEMMGKARKSATSRMKVKAAGMGADAVINVRYMTTSVVGSAAELLVYGTAVKLS